MLIKRPKYMEFLEKFKDNEQIKVITGIHRSGKTYIMKMFIEKLQSEDKINASNIVQMNFELFAFRKIRDADSLYQYVMEQKESSTYFLMKFNTLADGKRLSMLFGWT